MSSKIARRDFLKTGAATGLAASMFSYISCSGKKKERPNILYILTDQQHSFTLNENEENQFDTPNMDDIARNGVNFSHSYCTTPQCSPSRASLMTGQHTHRTGVVANTGYAGAGDSAESGDTIDRSHF